MSVRLHARPSRNERQKPNERKKNIAKVVKGGRGSESSRPGRVFFTILTFPQAAEVTGYQMF